MASDWAGPQAGDAGPASSDAFTPDSGGGLTGGGNRGSTLLAIDIPGNSFGPGASSVAPSSAGGTVPSATPLASSPSSGGSGWQGNPADGGWNPGGFLPGHSPDGSSQSAPPSAPPLWSLFLFLQDQGDRTIIPEPGALPAAPLSTPTTPNAPSPASAFIPGNVTAGQTLVSPTSQVPTAGATVAVHSHAMVADLDAPPSDRAASLAAGAATRSEVRGTMVLTHTVMPTRSAGASRVDDGGAPDAAAPVVEESSPTPRGADLIAEALPLAGDALERGLDEFVRQLEAVDVAGIVTQGPTPLVVATLSAAGAAASAMVVREIARRRGLRRTDGRFRIVDPLGRELGLSFPELPRSWSERY
jgi:hypothetical protein